MIFALAEVEKNIRSVAEEQYKTRGKWEALR